METKKFKICLVGCGRHARLAHGPSLQKYAREDADVALSGVCDLNLEAARALAAEFGFANAYADCETMLASEKPDAVSVVLPEHLTCQACLPLLESGIPLLIEKPVAMTSAELASMSAAAERGKASTSVAFNRRYTPLMRLARYVLQENIAPEDVFQIEYDMIRHARRDADFSTTAVHALDALLFLARSPLREARFRYRDVERGNPVVTNVAMDGVCESGTEVRLNVLPLAGVTLERASVHARGHTLLLEIALRGTAPEGRLRYWRADKLDFEMETGDGELSPEAACVQNGFFEENKAFFDSLRHGGQVELRVQDCAQQIALMEAIRQRVSALDFSHK